MRSNNILTFVVLLITNVNQLHKSDAENTVLSNNFNSLELFDYHNWGDWGEWERCPEGKYATAFQIRNHHYSYDIQDNTGVNAIALYCNAPAERKRDNYLMSSVESKGNWEEIKDCNDGLLNSFQLSYLLYQGPRGYSPIYSLNQDDAAVIDVWFYCIGDNPETVKTGMSGGGTTLIYKSKWTQRKTCPKGEAICGIKTQVAKYQANEDNVGLNNVDFECCPILSPAKTCIPVDRLEMVTECDNFGGTTPLKCSRTTGYRTLDVDSNANTAKEESPLLKELGFTLTQAAPLLESTFSTKLGRSVVTGHEWNTEHSSMFSEFVINNFSFDVPRGTITQLYQVVGQCGPYTVKTMQMTKVDIDENGNSSNEVPFVVEIDEEGEKNTTEEEEAQHTIISNNFDNSDFYKSWGDWGEWERCPKGMYATAFQIRNHPLSSDINTDNTGVNAIALYCNEPGGMSRDKSVMSSVESYGEWEEVKDCSDGLLNSFQLSYLGYQGQGRDFDYHYGRSRDDAAVIDIWFYCTNNKETSGKGISGGGSTSSKAKWTSKKTCLKREAICGLKTQIVKNKSDSPDNIGLNNVKFECCPIIGPAATCQPSDHMELVTECNNIVGKTPFSCSRTIFYGTLESNTNGNTTKEEVYPLKELGIDLKVEREMLKSTFSSKIGKSDTTGHEWKLESTSTFTDFVLATVSSDVPAGIKTKLYQAVGQCRPYIVRTLQIMRIDYDKHGNDIYSTEVEVDSDAV